MLLSSARYFTHERADLHPYVKENVSWPGAGSRGVSLPDLLSPADRAGLTDWKHHMLADSTAASLAIADGGLSQPYCGLSFFRSPKRCGDLLRCLRARGTMGSRRGATPPDDYIGIPLVNKKNGMIRIAFDARLINCAFKRLPSTDSSTVAPIGRAGSGDAVSSIAIADVQNGFYAIGVPSCLSLLSALPPIRADFVEVGQLGGIDGNPRDLVTPFLHVVSMSRSGALHLCQRGVDGVLECRVGASPTVLDRHYGVLLSPGAPLVGVAYIDNVAVFGKDRFATDHMFKIVVRDTEATALVIHEVFDPTNGLVNVKKKKVWLVRPALNEILGRNLASSEMLEIVMGHCFWCMFVDKGGLTILDRIYAFSASSGPGVRPLLHDVRREPWRLRFFVSFLLSNFSRLWSSTIYASDASPLGIVVCARDLHLDVARSIGSLSEKWRVKTIDGINVSVHAFDNGGHALSVRNVDDFEPLVSLDGQSLAEVDFKLLSEQGAGVCCAGFLPNEMSRAPHLGFELLNSIVSIMVGFTIIFVLVLPIQPTSRRASTSTGGPLRVLILSTVWIAAVAPPAVKPTGGESDGDQRSLDTSHDVVSYVGGGATIGLGEPPHGCDPYDFFHERVRQPDGSFLTVGRWAGMIATRESHPELPSPSPTSPNAESSGSPAVMHTLGTCCRSDLNAGGRRSPLIVPRDSILATIASPSQISFNSDDGMLTDSDGDRAHEFLLEDRGTGLLVRRASPTVSYSGDSISSGDLEGSYGTPVQMCGMISDSERDASDNQSVRADAQPAPPSPSFVPARRRSPLPMPGQPTPSSLFSTRGRRSPLPMPERQLPRTRSPSCVTAPSTVSDTSEDIRDF